MRRYLVLTAALALAACDRGVVLPAPTNLYYDLDVSGDPTAPAGILWTWDAIESSDLQGYRIYSRPDQSSPFGLRALTTSTSFHDVGKPEAEYFVVGLNKEDREGIPSDPVLVDERLRLPAPVSIASTSLNGAIYLVWSDNAYDADPNGFSKYHVYSCAYSLDDGTCGDWGREGTTVAPEFLVGVLPNGQAREFAVSAETIEGWESLWSPTIVDTPRPDARNVVVWANDVDGTKSGFRFDQAGVLGVVGDGSGSDIDVRVTRDGSGNFFLVPVRAGTTLRMYDSQPIDDLTSIDNAPATGYGTAAQQALVGYGYVFQMTPGDGFYRYGGLRVTHVGQQFVIFDWSYQTDPGNPMLSVIGR